MCAISLRQSSNDIIYFIQPPPDQGLGADGEDVGALSEWGFADTSLISGQQIYSAKAEEVGDSIAVKRTKNKSSSGTRKSKVGWFIIVSASFFLFI